MSTIAEQFTATIKAAYPDGYHSPDGTYQPPPKQHCTTCGEPRPPTGGICMNCRRTNINLRYHIKTFSTAGCDCEPCHHYRETGKLRKPKTCCTICGNPKQGNRDCIICRRAAPKSPETTRGYRM